MSKKETEFSRVERMKRLERETEVQKRKAIDLPEGNRKGGKPKSGETPVRKNRVKGYESDFDEDYNYG